jgi:ribosomal protein S18 acetylase RimI-like enzyme
MATSPTLQLVRAESLDDWDDARRLIREMIDWDVAECRSLGFEADEVIRTFYPDTLTEIRRHSSAPAGCFLLANLPDGSAGCAAFKRFSEEACELYDVYVASSFRGMGVGAALLGSLIQSARAARYRTMYLETAPFMTSAGRLYRSLGFEVIPPYRPTSDRLAPITIAMRLAL